MRPLESKMSRFAAVALVLCLSIISATAQTGDDIKQAKGEVGSELQVCAIYFRIRRSCLSLQDPALARTYGEMADKVADLAISSFRTVGVSDEVYAAQESLYTEAMINAMRGDCTNIAVLLPRYSRFCQRLSQDADPRLKEWIACVRAYGKQALGDAWRPTDDEVMPISEREPRSERQPRDG